jgi:colanic acid biosynthesis glycosyl transferase WcaI
VTSFRGGSALGLACFGAAGLGPAEPRRAKSRLAEGKRARGGNVCFPHAQRPLLLVFNQYYWPAVEATAHLLTELCEGLADEYDITVVTGAHPDAPPGRSTRNGVDIVRVQSTSYDRRRLPLRAANYLTYVGLSALAGVGGPRPDIVLCMTDPPFLGGLATVVARRFDSALVVISQDVFPEIAVQLKRLESPSLIFVLRTLVGAYLGAADRIVAIGETMRTRLEAKGADPARVRVIPYWVDTSSLVPLPHINEWARSKRLHRRFVVMHSGNVGHAQDLTSLVRAGTFLRDLDRLAIVVIGSGARHDELVALARRLDVDHVRFLPYQPRELLSQSLSTADVHVVGLARGLAGYVVPSRLYGILAVSRPVIVAADAESETAQIIERAGCGVVVPSGRPELLADAVRAAHDGAYDLAAMGAAGREYVVENADRAIAVDAYRALLRDLTR